jgi:hypothetical protein
MDPVSFMMALSEATVRHYEDLRNRASSGNMADALLEHNVKLAKGSRLPYHGFLNPVPLPAKVVIYEQEGSGFRAQEFPFSALPAYKNILDERRRLYHKVGFFERLSDDGSVEAASLPRASSGMNPESSFSSSPSSPSSVSSQINDFSGDYTMSQSPSPNQPGFPGPSGPAVPSMGRPDSYTVPHQGFVDQTPAARPFPSSMANLPSSSSAVLPNNLSSTANSPASPVSSATPPRPGVQRSAFASSSPVLQRMPAQPMQRIVYELPGYGTLETSCYQVVRKGAHLILVWDRSFPSGVRFSPSNTSGSMLLWVEGVSHVFEVKYSGIEFSLDSKDLVILDILNTYDYPASLNQDSTPRDSASTFASTFPSSSSVRSSPSGSSQVSVSSSSTESFFAALSAPVASQVSDSRSQSYDASPRTDFAFPQNQHEDDEGVARQDSFGVLDSLEPEDSGN